MCLPHLQHGPPSCPLHAGLVHTLCAYITLLKPCETFSWQARTSTAHAHANAQKRVQELRVRGVRVLTWSQLLAAGSDALLQQRRAGQQPAGSGSSASVGELRASVDDVLDGWPRSLPGPEDVATIMYTSGTTGSFVWLRFAANAHVRQSCGCNVAFGACMHVSCVEGCRSLLFVRDCVAGSYPPAAAFHGAHVIHLCLLHPIAPAGVPKGVVLKHRALVSVVASMTTFMVDPWGELRLAEVGARISDFT